MKLKKVETNASVMGFLCGADLRQAIEQVAVLEGISASDVIRRAVMFDCRRRKEQAVVEIVDQNSNRVADRLQRLTVR